MISKFLYTWLVRVMCQSASAVGSSLVSIANTKRGRKLYYLPGKKSKTRNRWFSAPAAWRPFQLQPRQTAHHFAWLFPASGTAHILDQFAQTNAWRGRVVIVSKSKRPVGAAKKCWGERQVDARCYRGVRMRRRPPFRCPTPNCLQ